MDDSPGILQFSDLVRQVRWVAVVVAGLTAVVVAADAVLSGPSLVAAVQWVGAGLALVLSISTVLAVVHALRGMDAAQKRGERLSGDDVGWRPPRREGQGPGFRSGSPSKDDEASA